MPIAAAMHDLRHARLLTDREDGFTLIELIVVVAIIGILLTIPITSFVVFRDRGNDAAAKADVRVIEPSIEGYFGDQDTYVGMTVAGLKSTYDSGIVTSLYQLADLTATGYCVQATSGGRTWHHVGPGGLPTAGACP